MTHIENSKPVSDNKEPKRWQWRVCAQVPTISPAEKSGFGFSFESSPAKRERTTEAIALAGDCDPVRQYPGVLVCGHDPLVVNTIHTMIR